MKFAKLLDGQVHEAWRQHYLDYRALKRALWEAQNDDAPVSVSPRTASLSVARHMAGGEDRDGTTAGEEHFMVKLQMEMAKVTAFAQSTAGALRQDLLTLMQRSNAMYTPRLSQLQSAAHELGDSVLALERFVQLNQAGFMKIIKKHDKAFPAAPLRSFFTQHLANHPWGTDGQPSLWALVSAIFQQLHTAPFSSTTAAAADVSSSNAAGPLPVLGAHASHASTTSADQLGSAVSGRAPRLSGTIGATSPGLVDANAVAVSYKYWVKQEDVSQVMYTILQHLPSVPGTSAPVEQQQAQQRQKEDPEAPNADVVLDTTVGTAAEDRPSAAAGHVEDSAHHQRRGTFADCSTTVRTVYLDNQSLELYHNRLYVRPDAATVKLVWSATGQGIPHQLILQRKVHRQGWKGDPNTKDTIMLFSNKVPGFMDGSYTLWQALQHMLPPATVTTPLGMQPSSDAVLPKHWTHQQQQPQDEKQQQVTQGDKQQQAAADESNMPGISGGSSVWDQSLDDLAQLPTCTKQLSLFSELQGLIARKRLRPVLSTAAQQLRFQMPFDPTLRITLETDVIMTSQAWDGPMTPAGWLQLLGEQLDDAPGVYRLPYCLLKITTSSPRAVGWPAWLQALVSGELVYEVEDWSKFVHGCAVLMLEQARAVPYWVDDPLIAASSKAFQDEWERLVDEEEAAALEQGHLGSRSSWPHGHSHSSSSLHHSHSNSNGRGRSSIHSEGQQGLHADKQLPMQHKRHGSTGSMLEGQGQPGDGRALARTQSSFGAGTSERAVARVLSLGPAGRFIARALSLRQPQHASAGSAPPRATDEFLMQLKKRRRGRRRHGHPAQLLALRDFLHNEDVFMTWLCMAVMLSGSALLLLSFSAIATVNPLSHPEIHIAEVIMLLLLPVSVVMVAYAMALYLWRSRRLYHPMRYWRVDDSWGPNLMALIIVIMLWAVLVVSMTDMAILIRKAHKHHIDPIPDPSPQPFPDTPPLPSPLPPPGMVLW